MNKKKKHVNKKHQRTKTRLKALKETSLKNKKKGGVKKPVVDDVAPKDDTKTASVKKESVKKSPAYKKAPEKKKAPAKKKTEEKK